MGQPLVESEATYVRTITKPELIPDPLTIKIADQRNGSGISGKGHACPPADPWTLALDTVLGLSLELLK